MSGAWDKNLKMITEVSAENSELRKDNLKKHYIKLNATILSVPYSEVWQWPPTQ